jgi:hypothetical protein
MGWMYGPKNNDGRHNHWKIRYFILLKFSPRCEQLTVGLSSRKILILLILNEPIKVQDFSLFYK